MELRVCSEDEKNQKLEEQKLHHENAEAGYNSKRQDKEAANKSWKGKTMVTEIVKTVGVLHLELLACQVSMVSAAN